MSKKEAENVSLPHTHTDTIHIHKHSPECIQHWSQSKAGHQVNSTHSGRGRPQGMTSDVECVCVILLGERDDELCHPECFQVGVVGAEPVVDVAGCVCVFMCVCVAAGKERQK